MVPKDEFIRIVRNMRKAQKQYFALTRARHPRADAKELAKALDDSKDHERRTRHAIKWALRDDFVDLVEQMLDAQQRFWKCRIDENRKVAMRLERDVDKRLKDFAGDGREQETLF